MAVPSGWDAVDSLIGQGCRIEGVVLFRGGLRIDGLIDGDVMADAPAGSWLLLSAPGRIEGDVRAENMVIAGEVVGNLHATGRVELLPRARIIGDIVYDSIAMHAGACVSGKLCPLPKRASGAQAIPGASGYNRALKDHQVQHAGALT